MMKKSKIISMLLVAIILLSYCPFTLAVITDAENGKMKYYKKDSSAFDIQGKVNGEWQSTTFRNGGYRTKLKVDNNEETRLHFDYNNDTERQIENGILWDIDCSFINNGRYAKITYTLKNTNETESTISLGTYVDVQIAGNDKATIERFENSKGLRLYDTNTNIQFSFYGKSVAGTTDIDNLWIGEYWDNYQEKCFENNSINKFEEKDSAFTFSWVNRKIAPGETKRYSVIIGMGEVSNAPKIELDANQGKCFSQDSVVINGFISDADANSKATLYYTIDDGEEKNLTEQTLVNNKVDFSLDLTSENLAVGTHKIKLWAIDESGNPSEILEKDILITNLKSPALNMSEEWSKDPVKFTITDEQNSADDVLKYQYKIGDGEWQDVELNTEVVALDETGTAVVIAKAVGKEADEQSSVVSKTAKVDKNAPKVEIVEQDGKIIVTATDEQSGMENVKYAIDISDETSLPAEDKFKDYTEAIDCKDIGQGTVHLYVIATDKLGNKFEGGKEYVDPIAAIINTKEKFNEEKPKYKLADEKKQYEKGYIYQIKVNNGEWQNINIDTEYTIEKPIAGTNTIMTRTIDTLGRISSESKKETTYIEKDKTIADKLLPDTGIERAIFGVLVISIIGTTCYIRYRKLKDIK